jgi:hemerythrin-like domain-containing protein
MTDPFYILKHEHRIIERGLRALDGLCLRLEWQTPLPDDALAQVVDFTGNFIDRFHHGKEEKYLFPLLSRHGIDENRGALGAMKHEHEIENDLTAKLGRAIAGCKRGDADAVRQFVEAAYNYSGHLVNHMQQEESILFKLADELLDEEEKASLMADFRKVESELGTDVYEKYTHMATAMEKEWSV